jgi:hypothetical protein
MKQSIGWYDFRNAFEGMGRDTQFSSEGLSALWEYLKEYEESTGEEIELDVIALCCEYAEGSAQEIARDYAIEIEGELAEAVKSYLEDDSNLISELQNGNFLYRQH